MYKMLRNYLKPEEKVRLNLIIVPDRETTILYMATYVRETKNTTWKEAALLGTYFYETAPLDK
eukprot:2665610-Ditylum_brightwellii.AAC.1